mgnify:CR=1 FL=1
MGKTGIITTENKNSEVYHDVIILLKYTVLYLGVCRFKSDR